ncbi:MAG: hypothetical protein AAGI69_10380 [Cyanobacteria bacterium P01_H01_bin.21]
MRQYQVASVAFSVFALSILNIRSISADTFTWQLYNQTSETLTEFYIVPSIFAGVEEPEDLGPNQLIQAIAPSSSAFISLDTNSPSCLYDFIGVFGSRLRIHESMIDLCNLDNGSYTFSDSYALDDDLFTFSESEPILLPESDEDNALWSFSDLDDPWLFSDPSDSGIPWPISGAPEDDNPWPFSNSDGQNREPGRLGTSGELVDTSTLTLNNKTRYALIDVYMTPSSANTFGRDKLTSRLNPEATREISLDVNYPECSYDLLGIFEDGSEVVDYGVDLCKLGGGTYSFLDPANETQDIQIYNGTTGNISGLRITAEYNETTNNGSRSGSYDQEIISSGELFRSGEEFLLTTELEVENCADFETYELTATFSDSTKETKNIDACSSETIVFGDPKPGVERRLTVQNGFDNAILWELYATKPADDDWGYDLLKEPVNSSGRSRRISLIDDVGDCLYDIRAVFIDPDPQSSKKLDPVDQYGVNVCELNNDTLRYSTSTIQSLRGVDIVESVASKVIEKQLYTSPPRGKTCLARSKSNVCRTSKKNPTQANRPWWRFWN